VVTQTVMRNTQKKSLLWDDSNRSPGETREEPPRTRAKENFTHIQANISRNDLNK